nr:sigma factor [Sorangium cellulosum]
MDPRDDASAFEAARPMLLGLAYRILGSRAEAEDAVARLGEEGAGALDGARRAR